MRTGAEAIEFIVAVHEGEGRPQARMTGRAEGAHGGCCLERGSCGWLREALE